MEQRIDQAVVSQFACNACLDTGIQHGTTDIDGEKVVVLRICKCQKVDKIKAGER